MDENNVELLMKYEKEKQDKINSQFNWTHYLSDNIILLIPGPQIGLLKPEKKLN